MSANSQMADGSPCEVRNGAFYRDKEDCWSPEEDYEGDFASFEGEWQVGFFARWPGGWWMGPYETEAEAIEALNREFME